MSEENVEVVRAYVEAYTAGGDAWADFLDDFMAEDVEIVPDASRFPEAKPFRGREEYRRYIRSDAHRGHRSLRRPPGRGRALSTREPDDYIDARTLDSSTRHYARDAFRAVRAVQRSLEAKLALPP